MLYPSPKSKKNIAEALIKYYDRAVATIKTKNKDGSKRTIGTNIFRFILKFMLSKNISEKNDSTFYLKAQETKIIKPPSEANINLYNKSKKIFERIIERFLE